MLIGINVQISVFVLADKVRIYEEMMTNTDNFESNLPTSIY